MKTALNEISGQTVLAQPEPAIIPTLLRIPMSATVAASALAGYLAFPETPLAFEAGLLTTAIFLLAAGCSTLNQVQERTDDARMARTRRRPLPAGRLRVASALLIAGALVVVGLLLLSRLEHPVAGWGMGALLLYNGLYTGLKKRTCFALLIGAVCGALPPIMGWCAAGGDPADQRIVGLATLFLLWQVPHTWSLCARYPEDYTTGPFASLFRYFDKVRLQRLSRIWLSALAVATLQLPIFATLQTPPTKVLCLALGSGLLGLAIRPAGTVTIALDKKLTLYMTALIGLVIFDQLLF